MRKGYLIIVKNYKAEIVEFKTISVVNTPDNIRLYYVHTKYGDDYFKECELKPTRKILEQECEEMNKALMRVLKCEKQ